MRRARAFIHCFFRQGQQETDRQSVHTLGPWLRLVDRPFDIDWALNPHSAHVTAKEAMVLSRLRRGPSVREAWTNRGRVLRRLGEQNAGRALGSRRPAAAQQSAPTGGSSQSHDLLRVFHFAHRSDIHVRPATFEMLRFPSMLSAKKLRDCRQKLLVSKLVAVSAQHPVG